MAADLAQTPVPFAALTSQPTNYSALPPPGSRALLATLSRSHAISHAGTPAAVGMYGAGAAAAATPLTGSRPGFSARTPAQSDRFNEGGCGTVLCTTPCSR
jgi:hypothetical protein